MDALTQTIVTWLNRKTGSRSRNLEITADTELIDQGVLDSLEILRLVSFLEDRFAITLPVEEFVPENFLTPTNVAAMIIRLRSPAHSAT